MIDKDINEILLLLREFYDHRVLQNTFTLCKPIIFHIIALLLFYSTFLGFLVSLNIHHQGISESEIRFCQIRGDLKSRWLSFWNF